MKTKKRLEWAEELSNIEFVMKEAATTRLDPQRIREIVEEVNGVADSKGNVTLRRTGKSKWEAIPANEVGQLDGAIRVSKARWLVHRLVEEERQRGATLSPEQGRLWTIFLNSVETALDKQKRNRVLEYFAPEDGDLRQLIESHVPPKADWGIVDLETKKMALLAEILREHVPEGSRRDRFITELESFLSEGREGVVHRRLLRKKFHDLCNGSSLIGYESILPILNALKQVWSKEKVKVPPFFEELAAAVIKDAKERSEASLHQTYTGLDGKTHRRTQSQQNQERGGNDNGHSR